MGNQAPETLPVAISQFCATVLREYPLMKQDLARLEEQRRDIAEAYPVASWGDGGGRGGAISDSTASAAFLLLRLEVTWAKTRFYVGAVDDLLAYLAPEQRQLVEYHFFKQYPGWKVLESLHIEKSAFYKRRQIILDLLANRLGL
ncbi:MAG: transcriptional regulator [Dethiobacteraceae bacterium]